MKIFLTAKNYLLILSKLYDEMIIVGQICFTNLEYTLNVEPIDAFDLESPSKTLIKVKTKIKSSYYVYVFRGTTDVIKKSCCKYQIYLAKISTKLLLLSLIHSYQVAQLRKRFVASASKIF